MSYANSGESRHPAHSHSPIKIPKDVKRLSYANSEDLDHPAHPHSQIRVFSSATFLLCFVNNSVSGQRKL